MLSKKLKSMLNYFTKSELILWCISVTFIIISFILFDRENFLKLAASLIGVTSLIFNAKGNPVGQFLMVIFSILYGIISFTFAYYGEMITYLGMTAPMAVVALISWLRNPYNGNKAEVKVNRLKYKEIIFMLLLTTMVTFLLYYILAAFHTANTGDFHPLETCATRRTTTKKYRQKSILFLYYLRFIFNDKKYSYSNDRSNDNSHEHLYA